MLYFVKDKIPKDLLEYFEPAECGRCYICKLVEVFREVKRTLKDDGTLWLNLGDSYFSSGTNMDRNWDGREKNFSKGKPMMNLHHDILKQKDLIGIPWRVAFALQADGWWLRQDIIWHKPNPMPESVTDRCTKSHEYIFLLAKNQKYYFDNEVIMENAVELYSEKRAKRPITSHGKEPTPSGNSNNLTYNKLRPNNKRNKRSVWTITTKPYKEAHFATYPPELVTPCVLAGSREGDVVLDPFIGSGTTAFVAKKLGRQYLGIELNPKYVDMANKRLTQLQERLL